MKNRRKKPIPPLSASAVFNDEKVALAATAAATQRLRAKDRPHASGVSCERIENGHAVRVSPLLEGDLALLQSFEPVILHIWVGS